MIPIGDTVQIGSPGKGPPSQFGIAIGMDAQVGGGVGPIALGAKAMAIGDGAIAVGYGAYANGKGAIAFGDGARAVGDGAVDIRPAPHFAPEHVEALREMMVQVFQGARAKVFSKDPDYTPA